MNEYIEIEDQDAMEQFLDRMDVAGFHDSIAKEMHLFHRSWVDSEGGLYSPRGADLRLLLQSQFDIRAVELLFVDIINIAVGDLGEFSSGAGEIKSESVPVERQWVEFSLDNDFRISAARIFYRERPDWFGVQPRFGPEVPTPQAIGGTWIDESWVQCEACADAVEVRGQEYVRCPGCGQVVEVPPRRGRE